MTLNAIYQAVKQCSSLEKQFISLLCLSGIGSLLLIFLNTFNCLSQPSFIATQFTAWAGLLITTPLLYFAIYPALRSVYTKDISSFSLNGIIYLCLILGYGYSLCTILFSFDAQKTFFEIILVILFFWYGTQFLQYYCQKTISLHINTLNSKNVHYVRLLQKNGAVEMTDCRQVACGQKLLIEPGEIFPLDGIILEGSTQIDEELLTGKSRVLPISSRDSVNAGFRNIKNPVVMITTSTYKKSSFANTFCQPSKKSFDSTILPSEPISLWHPLLVLTIISVTICWWLPYDAEFSLFCAISSLLIACPLTLAIAYPLTCIASILFCAKDGIFIKNNLALLHFSQTKLILFESGLAQPNLIAYFRDQDIDPVVLADPTKHRSPLLSFSPLLWDVRHASVSVKPDMAYNQDYLIKTLMIGQSMSASYTLKRATVGLCPQDADPYAILSADIVLKEFNDKSFKIVDRISQITRRTLQQNVIIALICNLGFLPFSAMGLLEPISILFGLILSVLLIVSNIGRMLLSSRMHVPMNSDTLHVTHMLTEK